MTKAEYLHTLSTALENRLPQREVQEIIADYGEYFETGLLEGKTEEELTREFGPPDMVARELLRDEAEGSLTESKSKPIVWVSPLLAKILAAVAGILVLSCLCLKAVDLSRYGCDLLLAAVIPVLLLVCRYNKLFKVKPKACARFSVPAAACLLGVLSLLTAALLFMSANAFALSEYLHDPIAFNRVLSHIMQLTVIIFLLTVLYLLYLSNAFAWAKGLVFFPFGVLFTVMDIHLVLHTMNSPETWGMSLLRSSMPLAAGTILSILLTLYFMRKQGGKRQEDVLSWTGR